ncbi:motility associated factor glycosyltransferase family protein [Lysinibacillus xylanilyticus]|uniref:motility associated factor glycosyltransferase family protein n=1 Tax=Lysinibacillus xylanilyticus TaxID=582475 RepID=UPI003CFCC4AD
MQFEKIESRDGNATLKVNNILLYSKYRPIIEAEKFIESEFNNDFKGYLLIGLGLGYHLKALLKLVTDSKPIFVYALDSQEIDLYKSISVSEELPGNVTISTDIKKVAIEGDYQIIMPHTWLQVMDKNHPLYYLLMDIKVKQMSYKRFSQKMEENFEKNIQQNHFSLMDSKENLEKKNIACLISSGPSLNITKKWLKNIRKKAYILCVGSALKILLEEKILPDAVIITDCQTNIAKQFNESGYTGDLFFLCTADYNTVKQHQGKKYILFQEGYNLAEHFVQQTQYPLLETGGSVATTGFSLLEYLGFKSIVLFGQDLGFTDENTHANNSTSGRKLLKDEEYIEVESNTRAPIKTLPNLNSYLRWFNRKCKESKCHVYNTAKEGAKIESVSLIDEEQFYEHIKNS